MLIRVGRISDALVLATFSQNPQLISETHETYFNTHSQAFIKHTFRAVYKRDLKSLVSESDLSQWKETVAVLLSYAGSEKQELINSLATRLLSTQPVAAMLCYLCSGNLDGAIQVWVGSENLSNASSSSSRESKTHSNPLVTLHLAVEKMATFASALKALGQLPQSQLLSAKYVQHLSKAPLKQL